MTDSRRSDYVVTIHGVGPCAPGSTLTEIGRYFAAKVGAVYRSAPRLVTGVEHACLESDRPAAPTLLEIRWTDIRVPQKSWATLLWHLARLLLAMLHLAETWHGRGQPPRRWLLRAYRLLLEFGVWSVPYIVYVMLLTALSFNGRLLIAVVVTGAVLGLAVAARHWSNTLALFGLLWAIVYGAVGAVALWGQSAWPGVIESASTSYVVRHQSFPFMILAVFAFCIASSRSILTMEQRLVRFMLAYLPFLAIAIVGACLWVIAIPPVADTPGYMEWSRIHAATLQAHHYDLKSAEYTHLASIVAFGVAALFTVLVYLARRGSQTIGLFCRNAIPVLAILVPVSTVVVAVVIARDLVLARSVDAADVLKVYEISAMRVIPFIPWLFGPLRITLDILGDVVLTALPPGHPMSIRDKLVERIRGALAHVEAAGAMNTVVLSHSLGTVIAAECIGSRHAPDHLVTMGSPLTSLHQRFLGLTLFRALEPDSSGPKTWRNYYRGGDYVGGPVDGLPAEDNIYMGPGGHTGYWRDEQVIQAIDAIRSGTPSHHHAV